MDALLVALNAKYVHTSLSIRSLASYCGDLFEIDTLELTINDRFERMRSAIFHRRAPLVGFSCYIWNIELTLKLAQALKKMDPSVTIFLGGPEVSFDAEELLLKYDTIDLIIQGEGEVPLLRLLETNRYEDVPSLVWRDHNGIRVNPPAVPLPLEAIPFAYHKPFPSAPQIIYYESSRGCPFACGFCLSGGTGVRFLSEERAIAELTAFANANVHQVKLVDRTFNADPKRALRIWRALSMLQTQTNFHFEIAAQLLDEESVAVLQRAPKGRFQLEIGVQTTNPDTLKAIHRPEKFEEISHAVKTLKETGNIHLHLDLIAGLPEESFAQFARSFDNVFALRPHMLQLGFLKLLKGSLLRANASSFEAVYADYPPYEILSTASITAADLLSLKQCEAAVDRFYHAGHTRVSLDYLLRSESSPFSFFMRLGLYIEHRECANPLNAVETLWAFAAQEGSADDGLKALLLYDWLVPQKRGMLPAGFDAEVSPADSEKIRSFYRLRASAELGLQLQDTQAWRHCTVHVYPVDLFALIKNGTRISRRCVVLFDYTNGNCREIEL